MGRRFLGYEPPDSLARAVKSRGKPWLTTDPHAGDAAAGRSTSAKVEVPGKAVRLLVFPCLVPGAV